MSYYSPLFYIDVITYPCHNPGPVFCLLLWVSSGCAWPITGQVTSVTWPVIGWAWSELTPNKRQKTDPDAGFASLCWQKEFLVIFRFMVDCIILSCLLQNVIADKDKHLLSTLFVFMSLLVSSYLSSLVYPCWYIQLPPPVIKGWKLYSWLCCIIFVEGDFSLVR